MAFFLGRPATRRQHFDALDGLRGLAVLIVIASHLSLLGFLPGLPLGGAGKSGVYLFFVLSAFLLTRMLLERTPAQFRNARLWASYAMRRVLRIWPLYLVVLTASWWFTRAGVDAWPYALDTDALLRHLALVEGRSVLWSIPVEFTFYAFLPFVALALTWAAHRGITIAWQGVAMVLAIIVCTILWPPGETARNDVDLGPYVVVFLCGCFAATLDRRLAERPLLPSWAWGLVALAALAVAALAVPAAWARVTGTALDLRVSHHWFLMFGIAWSALLLSVLHGPRWLRGVFASAPARLVGVVSFSAYLWHLPVLSGLRMAGVRDWPAAGVVVSVAVLLVSMASFVVIERPWRDVRFPVGAASDARRVGGKITRPAEGRSPK